MTHNFKTGVTYKTQGGEAIKRGERKLIKGEGI